MPVEPDFWFTEGDLPDPFIYEVSDQNGIVDLTGATNIKFSMTNRVSGAVVIDHVAGVIATSPGTDGKLKYTWVTIDREIVRGDYSVEFEWDQGGKHYSAPTYPKAWIKVVKAVAV